MFEAHGSHRIEINDRILRIDAFDAWNEQQSKDFVALLRNEIDTKAQFETEQEAIDWIRLSLSSLNELST